MTGYGYSGVQLPAPRTHSQVRQSHCPPSRSAGRWCITLSGLALVPTSSSYALCANTDHSSTFATPLVFDVDFLILLRAHATSFRLHTLTRSVLVLAVHCKTLTRQLRGSMHRHIRYLLPDRTKDISINQHFRSR